MIDIVCEAASPRRAIQNAKPSLSPQVSKSPYRLTDREQPPSTAPRFNSSSPLAHCADWTLVRFFKVATASESSGDEFGILEDDRCIDKGVFQHRLLLHELVLACSPPSPPRPQISYTILSHADWCAIWAVARCELGLRLVVKTKKSRARVNW